MTTVRLPADIEVQLDALAKGKNTTKSELIKEALEGYLVKEASVSDSYALGCDVFGRYGSTERDRSVTYKRRIREKINDAHRSH